MYPLPAAYETPGKAAGIKAVAVATPFRYGCMVVPLNTAHIWFQAFVIHPLVTVACPGSTAGNIITNAFDCCAHLHSMMLFPGAPFPMSNILAEFGFPVGKYQAHIEKEDGMVMAGMARYCILLFPSASPPGCGK